jgi:hypothetical protein
VTDYIAEPAPVARPYCPGCEPDADAVREILEVRWCDTHLPARDGPDDARVMPEGFLSPGSEAGGDDNRRWCELLHRGAPARAAAAGRQRA